MTFTFDLDTHPKAELLRLIVRATELHDQFDIARRRGEKVYLRFIKANCTEAVTLDDKIASTRARTPEAIRAKVEYALRDVDPTEPMLGYGGIKAVPMSALWDVLAAEA